MTPSGRQFARDEPGAASAPRGASPAKPPPTEATATVGIRRREFMGTGMLATAFCAISWPYHRGWAGEPDWSDGTAWNDGRGWFS